MLKFNSKRDKKGHRIRIETSLCGSELLNTPKLNKGSAFTNKEREAFQLTGKLPDRVENIEEQIKRVYGQYQQIESNLEKNIFLNNLHDSNEVLFFKLISKNLVEMLPIVYTPTVGEAVQNFSLEFRRSRGLYIDYPHQDQIEKILENRLNPDVNLILVTDGEGVLGIGDQGVGGMDISIAKLMVYTICSGLDPNHLLPIQLDVGTNNKKLIDDPNYLGWRHERISGKEYDQFIDKFVSAVMKKLPGTFLHWEDFGRENAHKNLQRYRQTLPSFNDDIQGTGAITLACVLSAVNASAADLAKQRVVMFGAGTAGVGIADQIAAAMMQHGLSEQQARQCFYLIDRQGLLLTNSEGLLDFQQPYARNPEEVADWQLDKTEEIQLLDTVRNAKPTLLIGCSTVHGAFNEAIVKEMTKHNEHPIIFPLSNPTSLAEAEPKDILNWSQGKAIIATGSPFKPVEYNGTRHTIAQCNNAYVFPGIGLGVVACKATQVTDAMIWTACNTLANESPAKENITLSLLPDLTEVLPICQKIALAVAEKAREEGVAGIDNDADLEQAIRLASWQPEYVPFTKIKD